MSKGVDLDAIARRAADAASQALGEGQLVRDIEPLAGGHSGLTLVASLVNPSGVENRIVLKLAPPGRPAVGRHDVLRQAALLRGIARSGAAVAVPEVLFLSPGDPPLFAMAWVDGEAAEPVLDDVDVPAHLAETRALAAARMLAALHGIAPVDAGIDEAEEILSVGDELDRWARTMNAVDPDLRPRAADLLDRLRRDLPDELTPSIVHGDYRLGNILCVGSDLRAIIDWEIWSVSDPRIDLGWFTVFSDPAHFPGASYPAPGMPSGDILLSEYERIRGEVDAWPWFDAFGRFKMAAIMGHNLRRHREGRHHDPYQETLPPTILSLVDQGLEILE